MSYLNANIPVEYAQIRREYLYDLKKHHGEVEDCIIFGLSALTGRAILWLAIMETGAIFYRLPISALIQKGFDPDRVPRRRLDELKIRNGTQVNIYLLLTLRIQSLIYLTLIIQRYRTNISAHT